VTGPTRADAVRAMLEARTIAVVGASPRPGSFGARLLTELERSPSRPTVHLVNPRYDRIGARVCLPSLGEIPGPVDLVALAVGDHALEEQLVLAAGRGDRSSVIYGSAFESGVGMGGLRARLTSVANGAGMALCGAGCMGFVSVAHGLRAIGYVEPDPLPAGPVALVTHSGSAFSALLRADRRLGWSLAVSSGQELVTTTADYIDYALGLDGTRVVALLLETLRRPAALVAALHRAAAADVPVVALTVGGTPGGRAMVAAHSGALAGDDATWEALCESTGMIRVADLAEMTDTLELIGAGRRAPAPPAPGISPVHDSGAERALGPVGRGIASVHDSGAERNAIGPVGRGIASVHDSGAERALVVDVAHSLDLPFADIGPETTARLAALLDDGLDATNPLDVWGTGASARTVLAGSLTALAADPSVGAVALAVDLVHELDGDRSYIEAAIDAWDATTKPVCVLANLPSALDRTAARELRDHGLPVLEGTRSGLLALRHLLSLGAPPTPPAEVVAPEMRGRRARWVTRLAAGPLRADEALALLADYGIPGPAAHSAGSRAEALTAADAVGYPVVLKTDRPDISHKSDVGGVVVGLDGPEALAAAYDELAGRLGPDMVVMATAPPGVEMALGVVRDPLLGPLVVVGAGGVLVELLADRRVGMPPLTATAARRMVQRLAVRPVLDGIRGGIVADVGALAAAVVGLSHLAVELGDVIVALDVNPLRCGPGGVLALDALIELGPSQSRPG
jgi:acyl-CoA synthetase (NDP forming)